MSDLRKVVIRERRIVNTETGGILFTATEDDDRRYGTDSFDRWVERHSLYHPVHVEVWEQTYYVTEATWERVEPQPLAAEARDA